ncbi:MAG: DUF6088 family protein [Paludibacteraceae bacterium]|nr:DUF6088 family protein [Paludibacteraceae bacterium]
MINGVKNNIKHLITSKGRAKFWFIDDFISCGNNSSVRKALQQLVQEEMLLRISQGVYYYPKIDRELGLGVLYPSKESTALAIAKHYKMKVAPTGAFALNALGLTNQMQTVVAFYTNGRARQIDLGENVYIRFLHTSNQLLFEYNSYWMVLAIQAMLELGEKQITESVRNRLAEIKTKVCERDFTHDLRIAPIWAQEILRKL